MSMRLNLSKAAVIHQTRTGGIDFRRYNGAEIYCDLRKSFRH